MPNYIRSKTGNMFFFTVVTWNRKKLFTDEHNRMVLSSVIKDVQVKYPFYNEAFVLLPDHIHCIWHIPDSDFSRRWAVIKKDFTKQVAHIHGRDIPEAKKIKREGAIWQPRFWEHQIRDEKDFETHCNYIHYNPVKHGLVKYPVEWAYSSFHRFVKEEKYSADWCASETVFDGMEVGE